MECNAYMQNRQSGLTPAEKFRINIKSTINRRGYIRYLHDKIMSESAAFDIKEEKSILIIVPRKAAGEEIVLSIFDKNKKDLVYETKAGLSFYDTEYDCTTINLEGTDLGAGLYFFCLKLQSSLYSAYCHRDNNEFILKEFNSTPDFQLSVSDFKYDEADNKLGGVIYHIFVDRFSKTKNIYNERRENYVKNWYAPLPDYPKKQGDNIKNDYFFGGTIYGIINKLDYLKKLGVTMLYLSPIFESPSNHKYDTADYFIVDKGFGGEKALKNLIKKAHEINIAIIIDGVFNHTGDDSVYFNKYGRYKSIGAFESIDSEYADWYTFTEFPNEYRSWWGIKILPKLNLNNEKCKNFFVGKGGVIEKYARLGIDGIRLDVADELSDEFISEIKSKIYEFDKSSVLYGEVWEDASNKTAYGKIKEYFLGKELDGVMNYPIRKGIISYIREKKSEDLFYALTNIINNAPKRIRDMQMNLLGSHDTERILTALAGETSIELDNETLSNKKMTSKEREVGIKRLKSAYAILATIPGIPSIYYGDEAGMEGYNDPFNRLTFPWNNVNAELHAHYTLINNLRHKYSVYKRGEYRLLHLDIDFLAFSRYNTNDKYVYLTLYNNSSHEMMISSAYPTLNLLTNINAASHKLANEEAIVLKALARHVIYVDPI